MGRRSWNSLVAQSLTVPHFSYTLLPKPLQRDAFDARQQILALVQLLVLRYGANPKEQFPLGLHSQHRQHYLKNSVCGIALMTSDGAVGREMVGVEDSMLRFYRGKKEHTVYDVFAAVPALRPN